jgi:hypothetical protein
LASAVTDWPPQADEYNQSRLRASTPRGLISLFVVDGLHGLPSLSPTDPDFGDDAELRRFAHEVLTPMMERAI